MTLKLVKLVDLLFPVVFLIGIALLVFGVFQYMSTKGDELSKKESKKTIFLGGIILSIAVLFFVVGYILHKNLVHIL